MPLFRSFWLPLALFAGLAVSHAAHAQVSIYGTVAYTGYGLSPDNGSSYYDKSGTPGFVLGGFYNFPIQSRLTAGLDLRLTNSPGTRGGTAGALALRIGVVPHHVPLRPYFQLGGGFVSSTTDAELINDGLTPGTYTTGAITLVFGLDIRITNTIDIRALEIGSQAGPSAGVGYIDTGIVYHFGNKH
jgi:hypothetical protein